MRDVFTRATLQRIPGERWIVIVAFAAGLAFFGLELAEHKGIVRAFFTGALTALVLMGVLGFAKGQWQGREVEEVGVPGGAHARLAPVARRTVRPLRALEGRVFDALTLRKLREVRMQGSNRDEERSVGDSPEERYEEFERKNGEAHREVEEALRELEELAREDKTSKHEKATGV